MNLSRRLVLGSFVESGTQGGVRRTGEGGFWLDSEAKAEKFPVDAVG
jgi:hypothetical protein